MSVGGASSVAAALGDEAVRTDYFEVMREPFAAAKADPTEVFRGTMKLGAAYNVFDGEELLEASVRSLRAGGVDWVCVVYQRVSNFGLPCSAKLMPTIEALLRSGAVDKAVEYTARPFASAAARQAVVSTRATADVLGGVSIAEIGEQFLHEVTKRELGRQECAAAGCSHFMSVDCDEFYAAAQLRWAKRLMATTRFEALFATMRHYYKSPCWQLEPPDKVNYVPVIYRVASWMPLRLGHPYPVMVDPTRRAENARYLRLAEPRELQMHHMSLVRDFPHGIRAKLGSVSNRANYFVTAITGGGDGGDTRTDPAEAFLAMFAAFDGPGKARPRHPHLFHDTLFRNVRVVPNQFGVRVEGVADEEGEAGEHPLPPAAAGAGSDKGGEASPPT